MSTAVQAVRVGISHVPFEAVHSGLRRHTAEAFDLLPAALLKLERDRACRFLPEVIPYCDTRRRIFAGARSAGPELAPGGPVDRARVEQMHTRGSNIRGEL